MMFLLKKIKFEVMTGDCLLLYPGSKLNPLQSAGKYCSKSRRIEKGHIILLTWPLGVVLVP